MKRLAVAKICGCLLFGAISISVSSASGQYYKPAQAPGSSQNQAGKRPLNQLPPIVTSNQLQQKTSASPKPVKGLYLPGESGNLPPIVTPPKQSSQPYVYGNGNATQNTAAPNTLPPITTPGQSRIPVFNSSTPIRPPSKPLTTNPAIVPQPKFQGSSSRSLPPQAPAGSGTRSLPPIVSPNNSSSPLPTQEFSNSIAPADLPDLPAIEIDETESSVIETAPGSDALPSQEIGTPIIDATTPRSVPGTSNYFDQPVPGTPSDLGCSSCGSSGCYDLATVQAQNGCCGNVVNAGYYLFADALFWTRQDGEIQFSTFFGLNDFNFVAGGRFTLGYRENATEGRELTYFGIGNLDESETFNNAAGNLQTTIVDAGGIANPVGFDNAVVHTHTKETQIHSLEYSRIRWGWDLLKTFIGVRYIYFDDSTSFFGTNNLGTNSFFTMDAVNNLFGADAGFELFYDVGYRTSASVQTKFGGYINVANVDTNLFTAGVQSLAQEEDDSAIASTIEINLMTHFQLSPRSRFRFGYDLFLGWGLFTVENNVPRPTFANGFSTGVDPLTPLTGTDLNTTNQPVFFHGPSVGFEVFR